MMDITGARFREIRKHLDLSRAEVGELLGLKGDPKNQERMLARWEKDEQDIVPSAFRLMLIFEKYPNVLAWCQGKDIVSEVPRSWSEALRED